MTNIINKYVDLSIPGAFSGKSGFLKNNKGLKPEEVEKELEN